MIYSILDGSKSGLQIFDKDWDFGYRTSSGGFKNSARKNRPLKFRASDKTLAGSYTVIYNVVVSELPSLSLNQTFILDVKVPCG